MVLAQLSVDGMHCGGCVTRVTNALKALPGVTVDSVVVGEAKVRYDDGVLNSAMLVQALEQMGFDARLQDNSWEKR
jgi:copper chaperone CopZ